MQTNKTNVLETAGEEDENEHIRDMLIITYELGNASLLCLPLLETDWLFLLESLLEPLVFPLMHTLPQLLLEA